MSKRIIRVFPDFMADPFWNPAPNHSNVDAEDLPNTIPASILIALKYWSRTWELMHTTPDYELNMSKAYKEAWNNDGLLLVDCLNSCQDEITFIYEEY